MKVLLVNGSPHEGGCTFTALREVADTLEKEGIETEFFHIGKGPFYGCVACGGCRKLGKCVFDDGVNELADRLAEADGVVIGSPVYFASANGALCAMLDRLFFSHHGFAGKPAAAVVSCRRGGASAAFDRLNKYFTINAMPVVSSTYWNSVHGNTPDEVRQDKEGLQVMRNVGHGMAWMLRNRAEGKAELTLEKGEHTNFIR